ncbi:MAG: threonylcarbamoyl-AMP synthase, partial [Clostridia bacterium]|nr:threonylcarbamoyl-AMP synthase [Clostridia bacterium]
MPSAEGCAGPGRLGACGGAAGAGGGAVVNTLVLHAAEPGAVATAATILRHGGLVAFPTETVYGLGADAFNEDAVRRIFAVKGRPPDNPLIVHVAGPRDVGRLSLEPSAARALIAAFWPGPLTLVLPRRPEVPAVVAAGLDSVAVRCPAHPVARALIAAAGTPLAAPSANRSGRPSPTWAADVLADLGGLIDAVLDGGPCPVGVESTVVDLTGPRPVLLRPGGVTVEALRRHLPDLETRSPAGPARSPGLRYRHYAPATPLWLYEGPSEPMVEAVCAEAARQREEGRRVVVLASAETADCYSRVADAVVTVGRRGVPETVAAGLFRALREADAAAGGPADGVILAEGY